jgi:hypothetical protein
LSTALSPIARRSALRRVPIEGWVLAAFDRGLDPISEGHRSTPLDALELRGLARDLSMQGTRLARRGSRRLKLALENCTRGVIDFQFFSCGSHRNQFHSRGRNGR